MLAQPHRGQAGEKETKIINLDDASIETKLNLLNEVNKALLCQLLILLVKTLLAIDKMN